MQSRSALLRLEGLLESLVGLVKNTDSWKEPTTRNSDVTGLGLEPYVCIPSEADVQILENY